MWRKKELPRASTPLTPEVHLLEAFGHEEFTLSLQLLGFNFHRRGLRSPRAGQGKGPQKKSKEAIRDSPGGKTGWTPVQEAGGLQMGKELQHAGHLLQKWWSM